MDCKEILPDLYELVCDTQQELASTFMRFQEHFESPIFKDKIFTREEFISWYTKNSPESKKQGKFSYYDEWESFNIPARILEPFYEGKFDPLTEQEIELLERFRKNRGKDFYIIGTFKGCDQSFRDHEISHGLYYLNNSYREDIREAMKTINPTILRRISNYLSLQAAYHDTVMEDETHAYLIALDKLLTEDAKISVEELKGPHKRLRMVFDAYLAAESRK